MFSKLTKLMALKGADRALEARNRVAEAIEKETAKLLQLVIERAAADRGLQEAQAAVAMTEQADDNAARRLAEQAHTAIERQSAVLASLRNRLATQAAEIEGQHRAVKDALPGHVERVKGEFAAEWGKAVGVFSALLGRRLALESRIGKLDLAAPSPSACELPAEISAPWSALAELENALEQIAGWSRAATPTAMLPNGHQPYDAQAIYVITHPASGMAPETLVVDAVLAPGALRHMNAIGYAVRLSDQDWAATVEAGRQAAASIESQAEREAFRKAEAEQEAAVRAMPTPPISQQRPNPEEDPEYQRKREQAENHAPMFNPHPEHVGTVTP